MPYVIIQHKVKKADWRGFEATFKSDTERRRKLGSKGGVVLRDLKDSEKVLVVLEWETVEGALQFVEGEDTEKAFLWASSSAWSKANATEEVIRTDA